MHSAVVPLVVDLNNALTTNIIKATKNKNTLLLLSGGHDTRVNLSIMLKNNIPFTTYTFRKQKGDIEIVKKIQKHYGFDYIIDYKKITEAIEGGVRDKYDVVLTGNRYTETLCSLHELNRSFDMIVNYVLQSKNNRNHYTPVTEPNVLEIIRKIPIVYLAGSVVQKKLIYYNEENLLKFPFTYYDWRHYLLNKFYPFFSDMIFNSFYRGKGREYVDNKKVKDVWWQ